MRPAAPGPDRRGSVFRARKARVAANHRTKTAPTARLNKYVAAISSPGLSRPAVARRFRPLLCAGLHYLPEEAIPTSISHGNHPWPS